MLWRFFSKINWCTTKCREATQDNAEVEELLSTPVKRVKKSPLMRVVGGGRAFWDKGSFPFCPVIGLT
jgi:hypothetical protein